MKITVLTGAGESAKRAWLMKYKEQFEDLGVDEVDLQTQPLTALMQRLLTPALFSRKQLLIIENAPAGLDLQKLTSEKVQDMEMVILTSQLSSTSTLYKSAKELLFQVLNFDADKELSAFPYLDKLIERDRSVFLELDKLLREYGGMYILSMIYYLLRRNLLPLPQNSFIRNKIKGQKLKVNEDSWQNLYYLILETEFKIKNGLTDEKSGLADLTLHWLTWNEE